MRRVGAEFHLADALFRIADGERRIRHKGESGRRVALQIRRNILHAAFLAAPQIEADGSFRQNAALLHAIHRVKRQHRRALVIRAAAPEKPVVAHIRRIGRLHPACPLRHDIQMGENADFLALFAAHQDASAVIIVVLGIHAHFTAHFKGRIQHFGAVFAKRISALRLAADAGNAHQGFHGFHHFLPMLIEIRVNP